MVLAILWTERFSYEHKLIQLWWYSWHNILEKNQEEKNILFFNYTWNCLSTFLVKLWVDEFATTTLTNFFCFHSVVFIETKTNYLVGIVLVAIALVIRVIVWSGRTSLLSGRMISIISGTWVHSFAVADVQKGCSDMIMRSALRHRKPKLWNQEQRSP